MNIPKKKKKNVLADTTARNLLLVVQDVVHCYFMCRAETLGPCRIYICGIEQFLFCCVSRPCDILYVIAAGRLNLSRVTSYSFNVLLYLFPAI